jgi:hypothetical protein
MNDIVGRPSQPRPLTQFAAAAPKRLAVLVLGMHRSGTSALGGVISALGIAGPKTLLAANNWNPRGYFESAPLYVLLDELLASAGSRWDDWQKIDPQWFNSEPAKQYRDRIIALLIDEFDDEPVIFIKDGRICRIVPFMLSVLAELDVTPVAMLPIRNPLEVARSLQRRDKLGLRKSLLLWLRHVLDADFDSRHLPRRMLLYQDLLADWRGYMDRAAKGMGLQWPDRSDVAGAVIDQFLSDGLRHEIASTQQLEDNPNVPPLVRNTYDILSKIATQGERQEWHEQLDLLRAEFDEGCRLFGPMVAAEELASTTQAVMLERDAAVAGHSSLIAERDRFAAERDRSIAERDAAVSAHDNLRIEHAMLAQAHETLAAERVALAAACKNLSAERDAMLMSRSWRLTAPLRRLRGLLR